jgi:transcriptional regulator with XRE-family HTH domain
MTAAQPADEQSAHHASVHQLFTHPRGGPTVVRMLLGAQLRRLREANRITREQAGYVIRASHSKISRLECGRVGFKERDVDDLLTLYGVDDDQRPGLLAMAREANAQHWWHKYGDILPSWFELYVALEEAAARFRTYESQFIPDLLQTEDYARAAIELRHPTARGEELERRTALGMRRQGLLTRGDAPRLWAVIDEAVLRRQLGGPEVMCRQLEHLLEVTRLPNVTLQVLPFSTGLSAAGGPFTVLRFQEPDLPDVVYLEQLNSALYLDKRRDIELYTQTVDALCTQAESPRATRALLARVIDEIKG